MRRRLNTHDLIVMTAIRCLDYLSCIKKRIDVLYVGHNNLRGMQLINSMFPTVNC